MLTRYRLMIVVAVLLITIVILFRSFGSDEKDSESLVVLNVKNNANVEGTDDSKVLLHIKVFYEVLCPDSKHFIVQQLYPAWKKLKELNMVHLVNIELIPFGKATSRVFQGKYVFRCQHGEEECQLNRIHSCVLNNESLSFETKLDMVKCSMNQPSRTTACGMNDCADGAELLHVAGQEQTKDLGDIGFVPTITINHSQNGQRQLLKNFYGEIMQLLKENGL